jgi:hypothetical protein
MKKEARMELEQRIKSLEAQVNTLQSDIRQTLGEIQKTLPEKPVRSSNWNRTAWVLAMVNLLVAVLLLDNSLLFAPLLKFFAPYPMAGTWFRALWIVLAFLWLLLQMYPLALLLTQEEREWKSVSWQNALKVVHARPGLMIVLTVFVLITILINAIAPAAWLVITLILLVAVAGLALRSLVDLRYKLS